MLLHQNVLGRTMIDKYINTIINHTIQLKNKPQKSHTNLKKNKEINAVRHFG